MAEPVSTTIAVGGTAGVMGALAYRLKADVIPCHQKGSLIANS